ncbi:MAG: TonB-dependent receptor [Chitinophagaceae bacterium]|nr:TonB-dependent receptor [Chitinophagaceae bacterium]
MKQCLLLLMMLVSSVFVFAQVHPEDNIIVDHEVSQPYRPARLYGKVVDSKTKKGVEAVSVQVVIQNPDSPGMDSVLAGMLTKPNGDFGFINLPLPEYFTVRFTAVGFGEFTEQVFLNRKPGEEANFQKDLGNIELGGEAEILNAVTVVAQRPTMQMGIDRQIYNVDKNLNAAGGTAVDIMRSIPSVAVDAEGNVELRNSSPTIFVDGRPTILTLDQIPSEDIERVELITNPSAKFDAASSGGIINVVLKKNKRLGLNGRVSAGVGIPEVLHGNLSLNFRQGKFNFFVSGNYNQSGGVAKTEASRQNKLNGVRQDYFNQASENERSRKFTSARFGIDFFADNRNTLSLSQHFVKGRFKNDEEQKQEYLDIQKTLLRYGNRTTDGFGQFDRSNTRLNYTHKFPKSGQELNADLTYNKGRGKNGSSIDNYFYYPDGSAYADPNRVRRDGHGNNDQLTMQVDYENPISEHSKIEMGLRGFINNNASMLDAFSLTNGSQVKLPLSSNVRYKESIYAGYITYTGKIKDIRYQAGLRSEFSKFDGTLVDSARNFGYKLPLDIGNIFDGFFPSLYLSKSITESQELQLNFSRRVRRPDFWQLNPFIDINDPMNLSQGNPAINPEYTNSFEFNYNNRYTNGSFMASVYFRNNQGDITNYSDTISAGVYEQLNNAGVDPNAILNTFINAQYTNRMGAEFIVQHKFGKLELVPSLNLQYRKVKAVVGKLNLNNQGFGWTSKLTANYKLASTLGAFNNMNFQARGEYHSSRVIPQGTIKPQYKIDLAVRKEFLKKNAASITFSVDDLLNSDRFGQIYDTETFYQDSYRRWNVRSFRLSFAYRFGDRDFNLFGNKQKEEGRSRMGDE